MNTSRENEFPAETLTVKRLRAIAKHYGWSASETQWRIANALVNLHDDVALFLWMMDSVSSQETGREPYHQTPPTENDPLVVAQRQNADDSTRVQKAVLEVLAHADAPLSTDEIKQKLLQRKRSH